MQGIDEWLTGEDESTVAGVGEGARGGGNEGKEIWGLAYLGWCRRPCFVLPLPCASRHPLELVCVLPLWVRCWLHWNACSTGASTMVVLHPR